jgi:ZIP family zinc transporter
MTLWQTAVLGALAGFTIYIGLPVARLGPWTRTVQNVLSTLAIGILGFLVLDILSKAEAAIDEAFRTATTSGQWGMFGTLALMLVLGLVLGLIGLVTYRRAAARRRPPVGMPRAQQLVLIIAAALGLHNLTEGLVLGQAASSGAIGFAIILVVGFGIHNITEGFVVAAPMAVTRDAPSWSFLGVVGLIAGGPTLLGTLIGYRVTSTPASVFCLALAAGALFYVIGDMLALAWRFGQHLISVWGLVVGFLAAYAIELLLTIAGT